MEKRTASASATSNQQFRKADAFMNVRVISKTGKTYSLSKGIPLYAIRDADRALMNLSEEDLKNLIAEDRLQVSIHAASSDEDVEF